MEYLFPRYFRQEFRKFRSQKLSEIIFRTRNNLYGLYLRLVIQYITASYPNQLPRKIQIEATSKCNLRCSSCPNSRNAGGGKHLKPDELKKILIQLNFRPNYIMLSGTGEPLCNPYFFDLVDILAENKIKCSFLTNGTMLKPSIQAEILSRTNINYVGISCDGAKKETFEANRVGADFEVWNKYVGAFIADAKKTSHLKIGMMSVLSRHNLKEIENTIRFAADIGFNSITFLDPIPIDNAAVSVCPSWADISGINEKNLCKFGLNLGLNVNFSWMRRKHTPPKSLVRCIMPWDYIQVRADGNVVPCSALFPADKLIYMGNLFHNKFDEIWHGNQFREFRHMCASGSNPLCKVCTYY